MSTTTDAQVEYELASQALEAARVKLFRVRAQMLAAKARDVSPGFSHGLLVALDAAWTLDVTRPTPRDVVFVVSDRRGRVLWTYTRTLDSDCEPSYATINSELFSCADWADLVSRVDPDADAPYKLMTESLGTHATIFSVTGRD